ncbi:uncharacterized protein LOC144142400 isoform X4 [Haemaphysalis longicornis]
MAMLADLSRGSSGVVPQSQDMRVAVSAADKGVQCSPGCVHQATQAGLTSLSSRGCQTAARLTAQVFYGPAGKVKSLSKPPGYSAATKRWEATSTGGSLGRLRSSASHEKQSPTYDILRDVAFAQDVAQIAFSCQKGLRNKAVCQVLCCGQLSC